MVFTAKTSSTLEFDKISGMLADCAFTDGAKARARALTPTDDYDTVVLRQMRTDDAKRLVNACKQPTLLPGGAAPLEYLQQP